MADTTSADNTIYENGMLEFQQHFNFDSLRKPLAVDSKGLENEEHTSKIFNDLENFKLGVPITLINSKGKANTQKIVFNLRKHLLLCSKKKIPLSQIDEIRVGQKTNVFNNYQLKADVNHKIDVANCKSFSLMYTGKRNMSKSLDFICETEQERRLMVSAFYHTICSAKSLDNEMGFVMREFNSFGKDSLNRDEIKKLLERLNYTTSSEMLARMMAMVDRNDDCNLDFVEFSDLLKYLRSRPEIKMIFERYSSDSAQHLTIPQMIRFFKEEQQEDWKESDCIALITKYNHEELPHILFEQLEDYIVSDFNSAAIPKTRTIYQDTNRPITEYFINSSHNTYLAGHQLKGESSSEMYVKTLKSGVRCVELDVWDGADGEPIIFHGKTLTSQIKFSHVCQTIKTCAFEISPFPVILSLEVHCSVPQQIRMAHHLVEIFGDMLPTPLAEDAKVFPTLEQLKHKILLKGHRAAQVATTPGEIQDILNEDEDEQEEELDSSAGSVSASSSSSAASPSLTSSTSSSILKLGSSLATSLKLKKKKDDGAKKKPVKVKIADELSRLIYLIGSGYKSPDLSKMKSPAYMHSLSEGAINNVLGSYDSGKVVNLTQTHFIRGYPRGTRFDSSNFDPCPGWSLGMQMIALNHQTSSEPIWVNEGMFDDNGSSGFVLKPPALWFESNPSMQFDPTIQIRHPASKYSKLCVEVISGRQLPKYTKTTGGEVIDPFVTVSIHGCKYDKAEYKTKVIDNNGFNPYWGEEFTFPLINSQLAMLLIRVDDKDAFHRHNRIGHYSIRVENIRPGFRMIKLRNDVGDIIPLCNLLLRFTLLPIKKNDKKY
ncbi:phosphoinositide-specific phospholipase C [Heterostelium album PN500]|uniref:Phosphoinositide phospholipase C n=1 Tax=Heterostelium pallidum (strain ATCC 26659 / Pp 5 / PN500) TaxID=670386 RepID=D3BQ91_HETP5|nr:phosphoinositide-specific phospholipase C [Heterostelium album PN500]EFA76311.1 phosphoinositide-specific phospholipase C [Heterostelium album PN500]|eukprot:XP_020428443.1 phosphoinositide-specific phospholipase C [Heterostelium album PN500]